MLLDKTGGDLALGAGKTLKMNTAKRNVLCFLLLLSLTFGLTACQPKTVIEMPSDSSAASSENPNAESTPSVEAASEPVGEAGSEALATEPERTFAPQETGEEPNPQSPFGQLNSEEQTQLIAWLSQLASSYQNISQYFSDFARDLSAFSAEEGATLGDQEFFQNLTRQCREELAKISEQASQGLPAAADDLKAKADELSAWYDNFLTDLASLSPQSDHFVDQLSQELDQAMQRMQDFLNSLVAFSS